jgi:hypothetical protein
MPVTTRAAALRSQGGGNEASSSKRPSSSQASGKRTRKARQLQQQDQLKEHSSTVCEQSEPCSIFEHQSSVLPVESPRDQDSHRDDVNKRPEIETDDALEDFFPDQEVMLPVNEHIREPDTTSPLVFSDGNDDEKNHDGFDVSNSSPVISGDITIGTSTRGGKMVFMNNYGYIHMNETTDMIGWRCVKRNENCKATIYTLKSTGKFDHWNGKFHCHVIDVSDTRKREVLSNIKRRVLDEFIPIKVIIDEEYRKAKLSADEKKAMPLPMQIGEYDLL